MRLQKQNGITAMAMMPTVAFVITSDVMQYQMAKKIPIQLKLAMRNCATTWHAWLANHVVSLAAPMRLNVLSACLSLLSTADNCISRDSPSIPLISLRSLAQTNIHSAINPSATPICQPILDTQ